MAAKSNIRSMRFSDETVELIDRQIGDTFTQKFENLVARCNWELPAKEKELASVQAFIDKERKKLRRLQEANRELEQFSRQLDNAKKFFGYIEQSAKLINLSVTAAEKCNTD